MKVTVKDIARMAGVSPATVSFALNHKKGVSEETRQLILRIAKEAGYELNPSENMQKAIRFIVYKRHGCVVSDTPFFSSVIEGIERESSSQGYQLLVSHIFHEEHGLEGIREIIRQDDSAGWLILATEMLPEDLEVFREMRKPVLLLDSYFKHGHFDCVLINNTEAAYKATSYLAENGHKDIGYLHSSVYINNFKYRKAGYEEAMEEYRLERKEKFEFLLEPTLEGAYRDMKKMMEQPDTLLPTAFFADNDIIAFGAMKALQEKGIGIPGDVSIVGFDDMPFCEISNPRLTTIKVYKQEIGGTAVRRLLQKVEYQDPTIQKIEVDTQLVVRDSVRKVSLKKV